jgi:hypothetical protein
MDFSFFLPDPTSDIYDARKLFGFTFISAGT